MKTIFSTFFLCFGLILFQSCQNETNQDTRSLDEQTVHSIGVKPNIPTIAPPLAKVNVPYHQLKIDAKKGGNLSLDNGTIIEIPKDAFVDKNGQPVTGEVEIAYREFHNAAEIIASGIPMTDKTGEKYMQTAGMFEVKGSVANEAVEIADGKSLNVKMASFVEDGQNYDFFHFDEGTGEWQTQGTAEPQKNIVKAAKLKKLPKLPIEPVKPEAPKKEIEQFEFNVNYKKFPELQAYEGVMWQYAGSDSKKSPTNNEWIFDEDWPDMSLKKASNETYEILLSSDTKAFKMEVKPVLEGVNLQKAMADFDARQKKYAKIKEARKEEETRLAQEANFLRSFKIEQFGVFNWDVWKKPERMLVNASFDFGQDISDLNQIMVFLITADKRSVVRYSPQDFGKFSFDPNDNNEMVAILPNNKMAVFSRENFKKINIDALRSQGESPQYTFKMTVEDQEIQSMNDLNQVMAMN